MPAAPPDSWPTEQTPPSQKVIRGPELSGAPNFLGRGTELRRASSKASLALTLLLVVLVLLLSSSASSLLCVCCLRSLYLGSKSKSKAGALFGDDTDADDIFGESVKGGKSAARAVSTKKPSASLFAVLPLLLCERGSIHTYAYMCMCVCR